MAQIELTPEERDLLYLSITDRLTGLNDVFIAFEKGDFDAAQRLSGEFSDDLRLLHDDLGWGDSPLEGIQLRVPRDVWERSLTHIQRRAEEDSQRRKTLAEDLDEERRQIEALQSTCAALAEQLARSGGEPREGSA